MTLRRLLWYRIKILLSGLIHGKSHARLAKLLTVVVVIGVGFGGVSYGFHALFETLNKAGQTGRDIASFIITAVLHGIFFIALTIDIATTMNIFFLSSDLNLLMASPLSSTKVFLLKYVDSLASSSLLSIIIAVPAAFAFGAAASAPPIYYLFVVVAILMVLSIPVSVGTMLGLTISRYVPPRRIKEVLGLVGSLFGLAIWLSIQMVRFRISPDKANEMSGFSTLMAKYASIPIMRLLPSTYASRVLISSSVGDWSTGIINLSILLVVASLVLIGSIQVAKRAYLTGWIRTSTSAATQVKRARSKLPNILFFLPRFESAVAKASLKSYLRDPQQISQFVTFLIMLFVLAIVPGVGSQRGAGLEPRLITAMFYVAFIATFNTAMAMMIIDGKSFWLIIGSPVSPLRKVVSKITATLTFLLPLLFVLLATLVITRLIEARTCPFIIPAIIALSIAGASVGSAISLHYADWDWENPKRMHRIGGRIATVVLLLLFIAGSNIVVRYPGNSLTSSGALGIILAITIPIASVITLVSIIICSRELSKIEWRL